MQIVVFLIRWLIQYALVLLYINLGCKGGGVYTLHRFICVMNYRYLQYSLLDEELLSMRHFELYQPLDTQATEKNKTKASLDFTNKHMVSYSNQFLMTLFTYICIRKNHEIQQNHRNGLSSKYLDVIQS